MSKNYYVGGQWNVICDVCGIKYKAGESKKRWDGFQVCPTCFEYRHPQDFIRAKQDKISVPFVRPILPDVFTQVPYINNYFVTDYIDNGYIEEEIL